MNLFDLVAGLTLLISALIGLARGAVLEIVSLFAFAGAAALSVYLLPFATPVAARVVHPVWVSSAVAAGVSFLIAYMGLRLLGSSVSRSVRGHATLGPLDRTLGLAFGLTRALVVFGVVYLVFSVAPADQQPKVLTQARLYPLARGSGLALASLAPGGIARMQDFGASLRDRMSGVQPQPPQNAVEAGRAYGDPDQPAFPPPPEAASPQDRTLRIEVDASRRHHSPPDAPVE